MKLSSVLLLVAAVAARAASAAAAAVDHRPIGVPEEQAEVEVQAEVDVDEERRDLRGRKKNIPNEVKVQSEAGTYGRRRAKGRKSKAGKGKGKAKSGKGKGDGVDLCLDAYDEILSAPAFVYGSGGECGDNFEVQLACGSGHGDCTYAETSLRAGSTFALDTCLPFDLAERLAYDAGTGMCTLAGIDLKRRDEDSCRVPTAEYSARISFDAGGGGGALYIDFSTDGGHSYYTEEEGDGTRIATPYGLEGARRLRSTCVSRAFCGYSASHDGRGCMERRERIEDRSCPAVGLLGSSRGYRSEFCGDGPDGCMVASATGDYYDYFNIFCGGCIPDVGMGEVTSVREDLFLVNRESTVEGLELTTGMGKKRALGVTVPKSSVYENREARLFRTDRCCGGYAMDYWRNNNRKLNEQPVCVSKGCWPSGFECGKDGYYDEGCWKWKSAINFNGGWWSGCCSGQFVKTGGYWHSFNWVDVYSCS